MKAKIKFIMIVNIIFLQSCYLNPFLYNLIWSNDNNPNPLPYLLLGNQRSTSNANISTSNFTLGGSISGLTNTGLTLSSGTTNNESLAISSGATSFQFVNPISSGSNYNISITSQPTGLLCTLANNTGTITANTNNVTVSCVVRTLNSYKFSYSGANPTWTSAVCGVADESTGIGPYTFNVDAVNDDMLFTVNSNVTMTGVCDFLNQGEISLYIDGTKRQTSNYQRCWGQYSTMNTAFVIPSMSIGNHTMELKFCSTNSRGMTINTTNYTNILTATSVASILNYEGRASSILPNGTTTIPTSGSYVPIINGSNMAATYTPTNNVILWQSLNLGNTGVISVSGYRLNPITTEDYFLNDDGSAPVSLFTYTPVSAGIPTTISAYSSSVGGNTIISKALYDNTLNVLAFKVPTANTYGKVAYSGLATESEGTIMPLINIPITNVKSSRYLISFTGNNTSGNGNGNGCEFTLFINNSQIAKVPQQTSNVGQSLQSSMITIETVPSGGSVPVEIRFNRLGFGTCTVALATLTVIPLE